MWNAFIAKAKNATFLFHRNFMEYHADRFTDCSLLIFEGDKLISVLPGNRTGDVVHSHQGLTYGGLVFGNRVKMSQSIAIMQSILRFLNSKGVGKLNIKTIPAIYHLNPSGEMQYVLFLANAIKTRTDVLSVIDLTKPFKIAKTRRESIRRGERNGLIIKEEPNFKLFWDAILIPNLNAKHAASPVHSVAEIELLYERFPQNIRHFNVYDGDQIVAGTTVFISENVAHPQYISGNADKNALGSLDYLYHYLLTEIFGDKHFFDFGISNEQHGRKINSGLLFWKESFGAQPFTQDFYEVDTANYELLENVLL